VTLGQAASIGLGFILVIGTLAWIASLRLRDASIADIGWGLGFVALAWLYTALLGGNDGRTLTVAGLVTIWGLRLAAHIFRRSRGRGEDPRYAAMRRRSGPSFWWRSLFVVFWLQGSLLWCVALPLLAVPRATAPFPSALDLAALILFITGFAFEAVGDWQLARFRADPANRGAVMDRGLWRYSRHPNYFGDAVVWWGFFLFAVGAPGGWVTALGPALMTWLLRRVSGVTLLEEGLRASKPAYADYVARTPAFVPWFPKRGPRIGR
jgi:steroid 5-alpha reductase family enzyme